MTYTYDTADLTTPLAQVRLLIPDTREDTPLLQDEEITALLGVAEGSVRLATAEALEIIASDRALVQGVTRILDVTVDGTKVAAELRARAARLRNDELMGAGPSTEFGYAEDPAGIFALRDYYMDEVLVSG